MQCNGCQQLKTEIFELKSFIAQCFDKVFDRFNENDKQFNALKNILKDAVGEEYSLGSSTNQQNAGGTHCHNNNTTTNSSVGINNGLQTRSLQKKRKIDQNVDIIGHLFNLSMIPAHLSSNLNVSTPVDQGIDQKFAENVTKVLAGFERDNNISGDSHSAVVFMEENSDSNHQTPSASCQYSQLTPVRLENNSNLCSQSNCKTDDKGKRVNWNKLDPSDPQGRCPYCSKQFTRVFSVRRHISTLHANGSSSLSQQHSGNGGSSPGSGGGSTNGWQQHQSHTVDTHGQKSEPAVSQYF